MKTPLSDERLAEIRRHVMYEGPTDLGHVIATALMAPELLAEVERLRGIVQFHEALADVADDLRADLHECYKGLKNCDAEASRLRACVARLEALLRQVMWQPYYNDDGDPPWYFCAICNQPQDEGHAPDCELAAVLREAE